jgi:nucleoside-diphosphate-sugar epimerase
MKIVVTGGSGKIGHVVVRALRSSGHQVLSLDRRPPDDLSIPHRVIDLRDAPAVERAFEGHEAVCHLGEIPNISNGDRVGCYATNTNIGAAVLEAAATVGVRKMVYTSSCQVYGCWGAENGSIVPPVYLPLDENHPLQPRNPYALSKVSNETYARLVVDRTGMSIAAFRFPGVLQDEDWERGVAYMRQRRPNKPVRTDGFGTLIHVADAAEAYVRAMNATWAGFEAFHFVAPTVRSSRPVREALAERFPNAPLPADWPAFAAPVTTEKARRLLGWRATHDLPAPVAQVA